MLKTASREDRPEKQRQAITAEKKETIGIQERAIALLEKICDFTPAESSHSANFSSNNNAQVVGYHPTVAAGGPAVVGTSAVQQTLILLQKSFSLLVNGMAFELQLHDFLGDHFNVPVRLALLERVGVMEHISHMQATNNASLMDESATLAIFQERLESAILSFKDDVDSDTISKLQGRFRLKGAGSGSGDGCVFMNRILQDSIPFRAACNSSLYVYMEKIITYVIIKASPHLNLLLKTTEGAIIESSLGPDVTRSSVGKFYALPMLSLALQIINQALAEEKNYEDQKLSICVGHIMSPNVIGEKDDICLDPPFLLQDHHCLPPASSEAIDHSKNPKKITTTNITVRMHLSYQSFFCVDDGIHYDWIAIEK